MADPPTDGDTDGGGLRPPANVFYFVGDLAAGIDWYGQLLGSAPVEVQPQLAMFQVGSARLTVHVADDFNASAGLLGAVTYWDVALVDEVVASCVARGGVIHRGPKTIFTGDRLCQVLDPFGNLIGFRQAPAG
jgi:predicted enzyme related to lactoylglutathione lyase